MFGLKGMLGGAATFILFAIARAIYGSLGCATPSATQAYLASRTRRAARVSALSALSSSFGLGTIIGPALAPLFVLPFVGLPGPLFAFAAIAIVVFAAILLWLPNDRHAPARRRARRGDELSVAGLEPTGASVVAATSRRSRAAQVERPAHPRRGSSPGCVGPCPGGDADLPRLLRHRPAGARAHTGRKHSIAIVMMAGASATLAAQWGLIPRLGAQPARADPVGLADRRGGARR